ncbi:hypothetical protein BV20DRAFT_379317 [Pilatotrama ljubarskyi]|nr:hypothetical protein BV20DRAFT_379317 [Pilatotrama ljubarskyi]
MKADCIAYRRFDSTRAGGMQRHGRVRGQSTADGVSNVSQRRAIASDDAGGCCAAVDGTAARLRTVVVTVPRRRRVRGDACVPFRRRADGYKAIFDGRRGPQVHLGRTAKRGVAGLIAGGGNAGCKLPWWRGGRLLPCYGVGKIDANLSNVNGRDSCCIISENACQRRCFPRQNNGGTYRARFICERMETGTAERANGRVLGDADKGRSDVRDKRMCEDMIVGKMSRKRGGERRRGRGRREGLWESAAGWPR